MRIATPKERFDWPAQRNELRALWRCLTGRSAQYWFWAWGSRGVQWDEEGKYWLWGLGFFTLVRYHNAVGAGEWYISPNLD